MPAAELIELARKRPYEEFEARCLERLEGGTLTLTQLVAPYEEFKRSGQAARLATLTLMVFESVDPAADAEAALKLARIALVGSRDNQGLRDLTVDCYRRQYGHTERFNAILEASGITGGRPVRMALRLLDVCLTLQPGDTLISRMDDRVVEVDEIDRAHGLFTLRREGRITTLPAQEVVREYERVDGGDFRVMRQLRPDQLGDVIRNDPVAVVIGLIHAHGEHIDADRLKHELVPRYIERKDWSSWWTKARTQLKRSPHVIIEGRSPIILSYCAAGRTLEDETWSALESEKDSSGWVPLIERYLREKKARKEAPDLTLLYRVHDHMVASIAAIRPVRPGEALAGALALAQLGGKGLPITDESSALAVTMLREAPRPIELLTRLGSDAQRDRALEALRKARPDDWLAHAVAWLDSAPAALLEKLVGGAVEGGRSDDVQRFVDGGLDEVARHPELVYWLWKGTKHREALRLPSDDELFRMLLDTLSTLGRTVAADPVVVKGFRLRIKTALALRDYARARACLERISAAGAITVRQQLERLEGMGANAPSRLLAALREVHPELWVVQRKQPAPWEDPRIVWCTRAGLSKRSAALEELVNVKMHENAKRIGEAASHGDLSENSEYKFALEERDFLRAQVANLNSELALARVLEPHDVPDDRAGIGSRVTLRRVDDGSERVMTFLGPFESDAERAIYSYMAPVSQKLMGTRIGERVTLTFDGQDVVFEVVALVNDLSAPPA